MNDYKYYLQVTHSEYTKSARNSCTFKTNHENDRYTIRNEVSIRHACAKFLVHSQDTHYTNYVIAVMDEWIIFLNKCLVQCHIEF